MCSRVIEAVMNSKWLAMPAWDSASPAVVMVRSPVTNVTLSGGIGTGPQRIGPIGTLPSSRTGAVRRWPWSTRWKRPKCRTVGRMR